MFGSRDCCQAHLPNPKVRSSFAKHFILLAAALPQNNTSNDVSSHLRKLINLTLSLHGIRKAPLPLSLVHCHMVPSLEPAYKKPADLCDNISEKQGTTIVRTVPHMPRMKKLKGSRLTQH